MNYNSLMNKPTINYREIIGDNAVNEVGGITEEQFNTLLTTDLSSYYTKAQIDDLFSRSYVYREKSGSIVTFECPASVNGIDKVVSEIVAVQAGTGDPSPTNIRPISGHTEANVVVSPTTDAEDGTTTPIQFIVNGETNTIYSGYVEIKNGKVKAVATHGLQPLTNWNWTRESAGGGNYRFRSTSRAWDIYERASSNCISSVFTINRSPIGGAKVDNTLWVYTDGLVYVYCGTYTDATEFKEFVKNTQLLLPLITPIEYDLADVYISTQEGTNNIWCDSGDITVKALDKIIQG